MSDFQQSLADILTDTPERLVLSKQVSRSQEYRKVVIEKRATAIRSQNIPKSRYSTRTVAQTAWHNISPRRWAHSFYS